MKVAAAIAEILKREGVEYLCCYPRNGLIEPAAEAGIKPILVRQERTGVHMADAVGRVSCGDKVGVFAMQQGPGTENAFGGVAQAYAESVPLVVIPAGHPRAQADDLRLSRLPARDLSPHPRPQRGNGKGAGVPVRRRQHVDVAT